MSCSGTSPWGEPASLCRAAGVHVRLVSAQAVGECLPRARRRHVLLARALHQTEIRAELEMQRVRRVSSDLESTAVRRSILGERRDEHVTAGAHRVANLRDIARPIERGGEEVKGRAVVPYVDAVLRQIGREYVGLDPAYGRRTRAEPR